MDKRISQAIGCDALNTTADEARSNVQMLPPIMKQCGSKSLKSPNCFNYYDDLFSASIEMKEEFPEDECPQSSTAASCINKSGIYSNIVFENEELSKVPETQEIKQEVSEEELSFIKTEETHDDTDKFIAKTEMSEESRIMSNAGDTSVLYKVQTTQEIQSTMCGGILKNGFNLLTHNNEHVIIGPPTLVGNEGNELHKCQCCVEYVNHDNMLAHVEDVHSHKKHKSERYHESIKKIHAGRNVNEINHKCDFCKRIYKSKSALVSHLKKINYSYGRVFECWSRKKYSTPRHLYKHNIRQHDANVKITNNAALKTEFQCDICKKIFKYKSLLKTHITSIHYDYGKTFECWCRKQFRTPIHLYQHKKRQHNGNVTNNRALKGEFQCDICKKIFKYKSLLKTHITSIHYDYGKTFECWCRKQFRTPIHLYQHKKRQHNGNVTNNRALKGEFQCDICKKIFKYKSLLKTHITSIHYDYGKTFECWCRKQFRTPIHLYYHKKRQHDGNVTNNTALKGEFQCDICKKIFKYKSLLKTHITRIHYDYGKTFECWCRKQFRTPIHLNQHKRRQHDGNVTNNTALKGEFQCDICKKRFKSKNSLKRHMLSIHCDFVKAFKCWCGKQFLTSIYLYQHKVKHHGANIKITNDAAFKKEFQCDVCKKMFKTKGNLKQHTLRVHFDYDKAFDCWCGKQFPTPTHLYHHKYKQHSASVKSTYKAVLKKEFQCDICKKIFERKANLKQHILMIHCYYGKTFECWCGKQFRTPRHLYKHKNQQHGASNKSTNNDTLKTEFQCDICKKMFKNKINLRNHIKSIHYDYGKTFNCTCGKQFRTQRYLNKHKYRQHGASVVSGNNAALITKFQCDICKKMFKNKDILKSHIASIHYDYGKTFNCWCGKQFRTPIHLNNHKHRQHGASAKRRNNAALKKKSTRKN